MPKQAEAADSSPQEHQSLLQSAVDAALDRKAEKLKVLDLSKVSDFTDRFILASGTNERQVQAIADAIGDILRKNGLRPLHVEGYDHARWILLDYGGALVVHVFLAEVRELYDLERLWSDAPDLTAKYLAS